MLSEVRERQIFYDFIYIWNLIWTKDVMYDDYG